MASTPLITKSVLLVAACAFMLFVICATSGGMCLHVVCKHPCFQNTCRFSDLELTIHGFLDAESGEVGAMRIGEADCKEQFNVIPPLYRFSTCLMQ